MTPDRMLVVQLPDEMHKALRVRAAELGRPMSEIVRELLEAWLGGKVALSADKPKETTKEGK